jgi:hypothetical protein
VIVYSADSRDSLLRSRIEPSTREQVAAVDGVESAEYVRILDNLQRKKLSIGQEKTKWRGFLQGEQETATRAVRMRYVEGLKSMIAQAKDELELD